MITITKKQLVEKISVDTGQTKVQTKETVQFFLDAIISELERGNRIELRDFGVFEIKKRAARVGRNPRTGDVVKVPARNVVTFKVGRKMKHQVAESKLVATEMESKVTRSEKTNKAKAKAASSKKAAKAKKKSTSTKKANSKVAKAASAKKVESKVKAKSASTKKTTSKAKSKSTASKKKKS